MKTGEPFDPFATCGLKRYASKRVDMGPESFEEWVASMLSRAEELGVNPETDELSEIDPHLEANREREHNHLYRITESEETELTDSDVELVRPAIDTLSPSEVMELARYHFELEREVFGAGREGVAFDELSETEREYATFLSDIVERVKD